MQGIPWKRIWAPGCVVGISVTFSVDSKRFVKFCSRLNVKFVSNLIVKFTSSKFTKNFREILYT